LILGFAHLAVNTASLQATEPGWLERGYAREALYPDVTNHPSKRSFTGDYQPLHSLLLMKGAGLWSLELTEHGPTQGHNEQLLWQPEHIDVRVPDPEAFQRFLTQGLGLRAEDDGKLHLRRNLPGWSCALRIKQADTAAVRLDAEGPTALAFYSNRPAEDAQALLDLGASDCSGLFDLCLGGLTMSIILMRAPGGPLLELINPRTRPS
jgi:hypothetical protein